MMQHSYKILEPIQIRNRVCRNRIIMAAHSYGYANHECLPTQFLVRYLAERAKGGAGLVIMGGTSVSDREGIIPGMTMNADDKIIPWYKRIASSVHKYGGLILDQFYHPGGQVDSGEGIRVLAPSSVPHELVNSIPTELSISEIELIIHLFISAAQRAKLGTLDGIEIQAGQGFLIHQFLSPYFNRRADKYGADRFLFLFEVLKGIRETISDDMILGLRLTGDSMMPGDLTLSDAVELSRRVEDGSLVDYLHVIGATNSTIEGYRLSHGDSSVPNMNFVPYAREIKKAVSLPVIAASMITHPEEAEHIVSSGYADMVAMTRSHIADAEIVNKVAQGRLSDIRPCVLCNQGCVGNHWKGLDVRCIHNPATGRERELGIGTIKISRIKKRICIVGGGIAGMEVARVAALRGYHVSVFEKNNTLGGQILLAGKAPHRQGLLDIAHYLEAQIRKLRASVYLGVEVTEEDLVAVKDEYDAFVLATGATPFIPPVFRDVDLDSVYNVEQIFQEGGNIGQNVLVIDMDWRQNPLGVVEYLLQMGKKVTAISKSYYVGKGINEVTLASYYSRILNKASLLPLSELRYFNEGVAGIRNIVTNDVSDIKIDRVVVVSGAKSSDRLLKQMRQHNLPVYAVGDCVTPMGIPEAMLDASRLGRQL